MDWMDERGDDEWVDEWILIGDMDGVDYRGIELPFVLRY